MLTVVIAVAFAVAALAALLFAVMVIGIRSEPHAELRRHAPGPIAAVSRRMLGVYVGTPTDDQEPTQEACLTGHATTNTEEGDVG
jgi:hypothetical protein